MRIAGIIKQSVVDGDGLRYVIFVQGCPHHCKGCHNPETWDYDKGFEKPISEILAEIIEDPLLDGVTFSGGEPFIHAEELIEIGKFCKEHNLNVWCYTGYTYKELLNTDHVKNAKELLKYIDVLVDGKYVESKKCIDNFKGSSNQNIIYLSKIYN